MKYILKGIEDVHENACGQDQKTDSFIHHEFTEVSLHQVIERLECFLRGCGFIFSGNLDIVEKD